MIKFRRIVPLRLSKYKTLGFACCLVLIVKLLITGTIHTYKVDCLQERGRGSSLQTPHPNVQGEMIFNNKDMSHYNELAFHDNFHLRIVSEDPRTEHIWPSGEKDLVERCQKKNWEVHGILPKASVVVNFFDKEELVTLLRTVHSVIQRTPAHLLEEVILVADNCLKDDFHQTLDIYLEAVFHGKVSILRTTTTEGAIKARLTGIHAAKGEVVVCLDSHMEVREFWLEPLLYEIQTDRRTLATGHLDWIQKSGSGWRYLHGGSSWRTCFDMGLVFGFQEISGKLREARKEDPTEAVQSPMTIGAAYAIDRRFFQEIGEFDEGMEFWGGDNFDLSLRVWMFGGRVVNAPCSHLAHLEKPGMRDYRIGSVDAIYRNYKRFMQVWLPEYMEYFMPYFPDLEKIDAGDLSARYALKQRAQYNMSWYLTNIYPELGIPQIHGLAWGEIVNLRTEKCLSETFDGNIQMGKCGGPAQYSYFFWNRDQQELRFPIYVFNIRTSLVSSVPTKVIAKEAYTKHFRMNSSTKWLHWKNGPLMNEEENLCLQTKSDNLQIELVTCDFNNAYQKWVFSHYSKDYEDIIKGSSQKYGGLMRTLQKYKNYQSENTAT